MFDVVTLGSATIDVYAKTDARVLTLGAGARRHDVLTYPVGTKVLIGDLRIHTGGGGSNTAVGFSRLGKRAAYLGAVGEDDHGDWIVRELARERVRFIGARLALQTNYSVVLDARGHDRTILAYKGASDHLSWRAVPRLRTKWIYSSSLLGTSYDTLLRVSRRAAKEGIALAFNPSSYQCCLGLRTLSPLLRTLRVLTLNREEATELVGERPLREQLERLRVSGPMYVTITDGPKGSSCLGPKGAFFAPPLPVKVLETTGAGDAFGCGFVSALMDGHDEIMGLRLGSTNAESVISAYGAKNILLTKREAYARIKGERRRIREL
jgi:ribokinase